MKLQLCLASLLCLSYVRANCNSCLQSTVTMQTYLRTTTCLDEQVEAITGSKGCSKDPTNAADCKDFIEQHWHSMAANMYQNFMRAKQICEEVMGLCPDQQKQQLVHDEEMYQSTTSSTTFDPVDTCQECSTSFDKLADFFVKTTTIQAVDKFEEVHYCNLLDTDEEKRSCRANTSKYLPLALPALATMFQAKKDQYCCMLSEKYC